MFQDFRKNILVVVLASWALCGCLTSQNPIGDREVIGDDSPLLGYWLGVPDADGTATVISVFKDGDPDSVIAMMGKKAYKKGDVSAYESVSEDDASVFRVYLSKKRQLSPQFLKEGFLSAKALNNPRTQGYYDIAKYDVSSDGILSIWSATQYGFNKLALEKGLLTENDYDPVEMLLTLSSERMADFVNAYEGFPEGTSWKKIDLTADALNANINDAMNLFFEDAFDRKILQLTSPYETYERSFDWNPQPQGGRSEVWVEFYDEETTISYAITSWDGPDGKYAGVALAEMASDDQRLNVWVQEWVAAEGLTDVRVEKTMSDAGREMIVIAANDPEGQYGHKAVVFDHLGRPCIVHVSWSNSQSLNGQFFYQEDLDKDLKTILDQLS